LFVETAMVDNGPLPTEQRCSECGRAASDLTLPKPVSPLSWRLMMPAAVTLAAVIGLAFWLWASAQSYGTGDGTPGAVILVPPVTFTDLQRFAAEPPDRGGADRLLRQVLEQFEGGYVHKRPGDHRVEVALLQSTQRRGEIIAVGWPVVWYHGRKFSRYDDVVTRTGFRPVATNPTASETVPNGMLEDSDLISPRPRWAWERGTVNYRQRPEETGGVSVWFDFNVWAIVATMGLVAAGWMLIAIGQWLLRVVFRKRALRSRRWLPWVGALVVALVIAFQSIPAEWSDSPLYVFHGSQRTMFVNGRVQRNPNQTTALQSNGSVSLVRSLSGTPDGGTVLARNILETLATVPESPNNGYLAILIRPASVISGGSQTSFNETLPLASFGEFSYMTAPAPAPAPAAPGPGLGLGPTPGVGAASPVALPKGREFKLEQGFFSVSTSTGDPTIPHRYWNVRLDGLGSIIFVIWMLWVVLRGIAWLGVVIITKRRRRRHRCVACAYPLAGGASAMTAASAP